MALVPAFIELRSIFHRRIYAVLSTRQGWFIPVLNAVAGFGTYALASWLFDINGDLLVAGLVGLAFPTVLRSPITYTFSVTDERSLKANALSVVSNFYQGLLTDALASADTVQAYRRAQINKTLASKYSAERMERELRLLINELQIPESKDMREKQLRNAMDIPDDVQRREGLASLLQDMLPPDALKKWRRGNAPR